VEVAIVRHLPQPAATTQQFKVLDETRSGPSLKLTLSGQASSTETLMLRENAPGLNVTCAGATLGVAKNGLRLLTVTFPAGTGYVTTTVTFSW
jgi:hypothetical protein